MAIKFGEFKKVLTFAAPLRFEPLGEIKNDL